MSIRRSVGADGVRLAGPTRSRARAVAAQSWCGAGTTSTGHVACWIDVAAHRAEHERLHRSAAAAADDDQLGVVRVVDQRGAGGRLGDDELDLVGAARPRRLHRRSQQLLGCLAVRLDVDRRNHPRAGRRHHRRRHPRVDGTHAGAPDRRLVEPVPERLLRDLRPVDADHDHGSNVPPGRRMCRMDDRDRSSLRHRHAPDAGDARRHRGSGRRRRADAGRPDGQRAAGAGRRAARPGARALPADRDDGEPDRAQAPQPPGRRAHRGGALARARLRVRRRGRARGAAHRRPARQRRPAHGGPGARSDARPPRTSSTSARPCSSSRTRTTSRAGACGRSPSSTPSSRSPARPASASTWTARG